MTFFIFRNLPIISAENWKPATVKMPTTGELPEDLLRELEEGGGINKQTQARKDRHYQAFLDFIKIDQKVATPIVELPDDTLGKYFVVISFLFKSRERSSTKRVRLKLWMIG